MRNAYEDRVVEFEKVHKINPADMAELVRIVAPSPGLRVLDGCAGYGAVCKAILAQCADTEMWAYDFSRTQLARFRENLPEIPSERVRLETMCETGLTHGAFDVYVIKTGLQEVSYKKQLLTVRHAFDLLKPGGRFVVWQPIMDDEEGRDLFADTIREKDRLAGFMSMALDRYFATHDEFLHLFAQAGFTGVQVAHVIPYPLNAGNRLFELASRERQQHIRSQGAVTPADEESLARLGAARVEALCAYLRWRGEQASDALRQRVQFWDSGEDVGFTVTMRILVGHKPG